MIQKLSFDLETTNSPCCGWTQRTPAVATICASPHLARKWTLPGTSLVLATGPAVAVLLMTGDISDHVQLSLGSPHIATSEANRCLICTSERDKHH